MICASRPLALVAPLALALLSGCATQPEPTGGEVGLPNAGAGPFRALIQGEIGNLRTAPTALSDSRSLARDIAVIDLDGDPDTLGVVAFVAASVKENGEDPGPDSPTRVITRHGALDGRSFDRSALAVLTADLPWEGGVLAAPAAILVDGEVRLYYAAAGGIGLARGDAEGMAFEKHGDPVLAPQQGGWEAGAAPASPGILRLTDGTYRMFYEVSLPSGGTAIGEARSADGLSFERVGDTPVLLPGQDLTESGDPPYDSAAVGGPSPILADSGTGEGVIRVYYSATDAAGKRTIGLAARYGDSGPLSRAVAPVFGTSKPLDPREPCVVRFNGFTLLYATQRGSITSADPVVAAGVAPATVTLPPPDPE